MIEISVRQEDGHIGFSYSTKGIVDDGKVYEGAVGPIPLLRQSLMRICDDLEKARDRRINDLQNAVNSHLLPEKQRGELQTILSQNIKARDADRTLATVMKQSA